MEFSVEYLCAYYFCWWINQYYAYCCLVCLLYEVAKERNDRRANSQVTFRGNAAILMPSAAAIKEIESIEGITSMEAYYSDYTDQTIFRVFTRESSFGGDSAKGDKILYAVDRCLKNDGLIDRRLTLIEVPKAQIIKYDPTMGLCEEVVHICGDPEHTALRQPSNMDMESWELCGCDDCQSARPEGISNPWGDDSCDDASITESPKLSRRLSAERLAITT